MDGNHKRFGSTQHSYISKGSVITLHRDVRDQSNKGSEPNTKRSLRSPFRNSVSNTRNKKSRSMETGSQRGTFEKNWENLNFQKELEDPGNALVKSEIKKLIHVKEDIEGLHSEFEIMRRSKSYDEKLISAIKIRDLEVEKNQRHNYSYTSYLRGLSTLIEDYLSTLPKQIGRANTYVATSGTNQLLTKSYVNTYTSNQRKTTNNNMHTTSHYYNSTSPSKKSNSNQHLQNSALENLYTNLGHEVYTKLIKVFEKYCFYGKTYTNYNMDYSQFSNFMVQNKIYDKYITKTQTELIFNKIRNHNKSICFEEFIIVLMEISKLIFNWEKNFLKSFSYFINKYIINIPCLKKTPEEKNMERWYFFLEYDDFVEEIRKRLPNLHKIFVKHKVKDLKVSESIDTTNFIKMCKELKIIPVFLSTKEIITIINFVKYRKRSLVPTENFDFCSFVEIICVIALQAFDKYIHEETKHKYLEHVEKLKIFLNYINEKN